MEELLKLLEEAIRDYTIEAVEEARQEEQERTEDLLEDLEHAIAKYRRW